MSLRFKGSDLRPVLAEAIANQCKIILVKDRGVYFLSQRGERHPEGGQKLIAYAIGCNPGIDSFDDWWNLADAEMGGDDFGEYLDPNESVFKRILQDGCDLEVSATETELTFKAMAPVPKNN
jgi:hypothetical protein